MPDVGDQVTATLLVPEFDNTTSVSLLVVQPDGTSTSPGVSTPDNGNTWTAPITYTAAGVWTFKWTITGAGAGIEFQRVGVAPDPTSTPTGQRVYATTTDLANFLRAAPPVDSLSKLIDASKALEGALLTAIYDTSADGYPTSATHREAMKEAVCAIVEWRIETGDDLGAGGDWQSASAGGVSISRGAGTNGKTQSTQVTSNQLPYKAWLALTQAGLLPGTVSRR